MLLDPGEVARMRRNWRCWQTRFCCRPCKEQVLADGSHHTFTRPLRNKANWFIYDTHLVLLVINRPCLSPVQRVLANVSRDSWCRVRTDPTIYYMEKLCHCKRLRYFWTYPCGWNVCISMVLGQT